MSTFSTDDQEEQDDEEEQEDDDEDEEEIYDQLVRTASDYQTSDERGDVDMTKADTTEDMKDAHVTLTAATPVVQQQSSSMSDLVSKFISPTMDEDERSIKWGYSAQSNNLREEASSKIKHSSTTDQTCKNYRNQVKTQTSKIKSKVEKYVTESLEAEVLIRSTNQPQTSYGIASSLSELELKRILMDKIEENKSIDRSDV
ncbi:hypothetical protein Tco_0105547 [Tanacetum coccineum]